jgi:hypothetical protein
MMSLRLGSTSSRDDLIRSETPYESIFIVKGIGENANRRNFVPSRDQSAQTQEVGILGDMAMGKGRFGAHCAMGASEAG